MLLRGDRQHDIAAWFGVNGGRITEIANGHTFINITAAPNEMLPIPAPYPSGKEAVAAIEALEAARKAIIFAEQQILKRPNTH